MVHVVLSVPEGFVGVSEHEVVGGRVEACRVAHEHCVELFRIPLRELEGCADRVVGWRGGDVLHKHEIDARVAAQAHDGAVLVVPGCCCLDQVRSWQQAYRLGGGSVAGPVDGDARVWQATHGKGVVHDHRGRQRGIPEAYCKAVLARTEPVLEAGGLSLARQEVGLYDAQVRLESGLLGVAGVQAAL